LLAQTKTQRAEIQWSEPLEQLEDELALSIAGGGTTIGHGPVISI
jgi:hypothetical protein